MKSNKPVIDIRKKEPHFYVPIVVTLGLAIAYLLVFGWPAPASKRGTLNLAGAAQLIVCDNGRVMPLDTVARNNLMIISGVQTFEDAAGKRQPAIRWILDVMTMKMSSKEAAPAVDAKVFRVESDLLTGFLQLQPRASYRYSYNEIGPRLEALVDELQRLDASAEKEQSRFYASGTELFGHVKLFQSLAIYKRPLVIPPGQGISEWQTLPEAAKSIANNQSRDKIVKDYMSILVAYAEDDVEKFNDALSTYNEDVNPSLGESLRRTHFEVFFNRFAPFFHCSVLYVFVLLLACGSWVAFPGQLERSALALACLTLLLHTFAMFGRMYLMDRPLVFVTNLYSSAVFIGWMSCILGVVLELIYRNGLGCFVAGVLGSLTLLIGHYLATTGDTLEMMQAVLDTNFWLATHVTSVVIGYSATFFAGFLGIALVLMRVFAPAAYGEHYKTLGRMIYGIVCFAMLFSFVGTVLGGIWADQSWGRFWGWDPKENGALLIVVWNALILHARWGGMVGQRGMAVLAIAGNIVTAWSYFGVNMLGVGLHSYGNFKMSTLYWLLTFVAIQLVLVAVGLIPQRWLDALHAPAATDAGPALTGGKLAAE